MRKQQTQTAAVANPSAASETRRADRASKARATARADAKLARDDDEGDEGDEGETGGASQWARELARRAEGGNSACRRYDVLALALVQAYDEGKTSLSFADANKRSGLSRGERGDPVQSWRLAVQRMRATHGGAEAFERAFGIDVAVDAEGGRLLLSKAGA